MLFHGCSRSVDPESSRLYVEAQDAFEKAEALPPHEQPEAFRRVATRYRNLIERGVKSGPIYYNMGNALMRGEEPGQALAAYFVARRFMPLDPHLASNIQAISSRSPNQERSTSIIGHLFFWQDWIGTNRKVAISFWSATTTFLGGILCLFVRHRRVRRCVGVLLTITVISVTSTGYDWYRFEYLRHAVISTDEASPRKGNSEQYESAFTVPVVFGTTATVLDERNDWVRLRFDSGRDGWLPKDQVVEY